MHKNIKPVVLMLPVILILTVSSIGVIIVMAQKENGSSKKSDSTSNIKAEDMLWTNEALFSQVSKVKESKNESNRIVAVRRIFQVNDEFDKKRGYFKNKIQMVEIELYSKHAPQPTNALNVIVQLGDFMDYVRGTSGDGHTLFIVLKHEDFAGLIDGSIVTCFLSPGIISREKLREQYKNGEPAEVIGEKYGRLDKKMLDRFPVIEEDFITGNERRGKTKNLPE